MNESDMNEIRADGLTRTEMAATIGLAAICATAMLVLYYVAPLLPRPGGAVWWRLLIGAAIFTAVLVHELNSILRHGHPMRRAVVALAVLVPLFVVMFAVMYLTMSRSDPSAFGGTLTRTQALYFTITVLSTVGFGDISPKTDPARIVTSIQMVADLVLLAVIVKLIFGVASRATAHQHSSPDGESTEA